jgi:hypothetical protein
MIGAGYLWAGDYFKLERCGTENGYLNEAQYGSVRPPGLRIRKAEV